MINKKYDINDLLAIIKKLRSPGGCPWDRKQTHKSIRTHLIEETYEFVDAVNSGDSEHMSEELGDILLHVIFHADIEREKGGFTFLDVTDSISRKLIRRHPHVFKNVKVAGVPDIIRNWEEIKKGESTKKDRRFVMDRVPKSMSAMAKTEKVLGLAKKSGLLGRERDTKQISKELRLLTSGSGGKKKKMKTLGEILFSILEYSRTKGLDAEKALDQACRDYIKRHNAKEKSSR
jgi:tetrapyrrole methylase family protein / MazG family protein